MPEGRYDLTLYASDFAGNTASSVVPVNIDGTPPVINGNIDKLATFKDGKWNIPVNVTIIKEEHSGINNTVWKYNIDNGSVNALSLMKVGSIYSGNVQVSGLTGGVHAMTIYCADNAGNAASCQFSFNIDAVPPEIGYAPQFSTSPESASWTNSRTLSVNAADSDSGIGEFTADIRRETENGQWNIAENAVFNGSSITFIPGAVADGLYRIKLKATDKAGNEKEIILYVRIDLTGPVIVIPSGASGVNTISASATDASSGVDDASWEWREITSGTTDAWKTGKTAMLSEGTYRRVSFRVKDKNGNQTEKSGELTIDLSAPEANAEVPSYAVKNQLTIRITAQDRITAVEKVWFQIDNGTKTEVIPWSQPSFVIPVNNYSEGKHIIRIIAQDSVQHTGQSADYTFIIDRSAPEVLQVDLQGKSVPGLFLEDGAFSADSEILVTLHGKDQYIDNKMAENGTITAWYWDLKQDKNAQPVFSEERKYSSPEFSILNLREGTNYLYFRLEDGGGNFSETFRRVLGIDFTIPGAPRIRSTTHGEAKYPEQAVMLQTAEFNFIPVSGSLSGLKQYQWRLEKIYNPENIGAIPEAVLRGIVYPNAGSLTGQLSLYLADNLEREFYRLFVSSVSGNGLVSTETQYQFRIDSAAPVNLRITVAPQASAGEWYKERYARVMWNKPADMTGVAEYRYFITAGDVHLPTEEEELRVCDLSSWIKTTDNETEVDLKSFLGGLSSGKLQVAVCAIDYAGNRKITATAIQSDFARPIFIPAGEGAITVSEVPSGMEDAKKITWGTIQDNESGLDYLNLIISEEINSVNKIIRSLYIDPAAGEFTTDQLDNTAIYTVHIIAFDRAGNQSEAYKRFALDNRTLPANYTLSYSENINGFGLSGKRITGSGTDIFEDIQLEIPAQLSIYEITTTNGIEKKNFMKTIQLDEITTKENLPMSGKSRVSRFEVEADGFQIEGNRIIFDREMGIGLEDSKYTRPLIIQNIEENRTITIGKTQLGFPPVIRFLSGTGVIGDTAEIRTSSSLNGEGLFAGSGTVPGFTITQAEKLRIQSAREWLFGDALSFNAAELGKHGILLADKNGGLELEIAEGRAEAHSSNVLGVITIRPDNPLTLDLRGTVYGIKAAGIRGHYLDIYEAVLKLPQSYEPQELTIRNFTIDSQNGLVYAGADFYTNQISCKGPGGVFESHGVKFGLDGKLYISGTLISDTYGEINVDDFILTNQGLDWETGGNIQNFTTTIHGFSIIALSSRFTERGIFISQGLIVHKGDRRRFINLGLVHTHKDEIYAEGTITEEYFVETPYGTSLYIKGGIITGEGVFGTVAVPLGFTIKDSSGRESWEFPKVQFEYTGEMAGTLPKNQNINLGGFSYTAENIEFLGSHIKIGHLRSSSISGMEPAVLNFDNFSFNEKSVLGINPSKESPVFTINGWRIAYKNLKPVLTSELLDSGGIVSSQYKGYLQGAGILQLPEKLGSLTIDFPESRIAADGNFLSGKSGEINHSITIFDIPVELPEAELEKLGGNYVLSCETPRIDLSFNGKTAMDFGKTRFNSQGNVVEAEPGSGKSRFTASNGYRVDSDSRLIDQEGIWLTGSLSAVWWDEDIKIPITGKGIKLIAGFAVTGEAPAGEGRYTYAGWEISGTGFSFEYNGLTSVSNKASYRGYEIEFGRLKYNSAGLLPETVTLQQNTEILSLFGAVVKLTESRFSENGFEGSVAVTMPKPFDKHTLHFPIVQFKTDGKFSVNMEIEQYEADLGGFTFGFEGLTFDNNGLFIREAGVTLPATMEGTELRIHGIRLSDGSLAIENSSIDPVNFWGMGFALDNFSIQNGIVNLSGTVNLPITLPGILSGRSILIQDFTADLSGNITSFYVFTEDEFTIPFLDAWALTCKGLAVRYIDNQPWILINNSMFHFPSEFEANELVIEQIRFNPLKGEFDFDRIYAETALTMQFRGIKFVLSSFSINKERSFSFGGSAVFPETGMPPFIAGKTVKITTFEITRDGSLGTVAVTLNNLEGAVLPSRKGIFLQNGSLSLNKNDRTGLEVSITGDILLSSNMPGTMAESSLKIKNFIINTEKPGISRFEAEASFPSLEISVVKFSGIKIFVDWDGEKQNGGLCVSGGIILPSSFPGYLAGQTASIKDFRIDFDGGISSFSASYATTPGAVYTLLNSIQISDTVVSITRQVNYFDFALAGTVIFPEGKFPQGIGGLKTRIAVSLDTLMGIKTAYASVDIPNQKLFNSLQMKGARLELLKEENTPMGIDISGTLLLPDNFPNGLRGLEIKIGNFSINTDGKIKNIDIGVSKLNAKIFNYVEIKDCALTFSMGTGEEFIIDISGKLKLIAPALPNSLKDSEFYINRFKLSTRTGLQSFDAGFSGSLYFEILGGIGIRVNTLALNDTAITLSANATLPASYPKGLAETGFDLTVLKLGWNGQILEIQGGLGKMNIELAGFSVKIDSLYFEKNAGGQYYVSLKSCRLQLPSAFGSWGGKEIAIKNAQFDPYNGKFLGDIELPKFEVNVAGFILEMYNPTLEFTSNRIGFSLVNLKTPDFMKGVSLSLPEVKLSSTKGIEVKGGTFRLPDFKISQLSFSNIFVTFYIDGKEYIIGGGGTVVIPRAGTIGATLLFANRSEIYPIGLKQAEFSWIIGTGGIPLGNSGLYINGVSGGITYGPPNELPSKLQKLFEPKGPRLKLGMYIGDGYGGSYIQMNPNTWVDINNANWAMQGDALILKGSMNINSSASAAMNANGFYTGTQIELKFARGSTDIYIFTKNGKLIFSGRAYVEFRMPRGIISHYNILGIDIYVPPDDLWLMKTNSEFGVFNNGSAGFKTTIDLPILGEKGVFVGPGNFVIGDVSKYTIEKPSWSAPVLLKIAAPHAETNMSFVSTDTSDRIGPEETDYTAFVGDENLERLVFLLAYIEGDPVLTAISPSGKEYREGDGGTETVLYENVNALIIYKPESGLWKIRVSNAEENTYEITVLGGQALPLLEITEPVPGTELVQETFMLKGKTEKNALGIIVKAQENSEMPGLELGTFPVNQNGSFAIPVPVEDIPDGEYLISAELVTEDGLFSPITYAPGKIYVDRRGLPLYEPEPVRIAETDRGTVTLRWNNNNGARTSGYNIRMMNSATDTDIVFFAGDITSLSIPGFSHGDKVSFQVCAIDNLGKESSWSNPVSLTVGSERPSINKPSIANKLLKAIGYPGNLINGNIEVSISERQETYDSSGYILVRQDGPLDPSKGIIFFDGPVKIEGKALVIPWHLGLPENMVSGVYTYSCEAVNEANGSLNAPFVIEITVKWPKPEIQTVDPKEIDGSEERIITIYGSGFTPGTRILLDGKELVLRTKGEDFTGNTLEILLPVQKQAGIRLLTAAGQGGESAPVPITITLPGWRTNVYTPTVETNPGGAAEYWLGIRSIYGWKGEASFKTVEKPEGFSVELPVIPAGQNGRVRIITDSNTAPGIYRTVINGEEGCVDDGIELITVVTENSQDPHLSAASPASGFTGTEVRLYGYNLGNEGALYLNEIPLPYSSWQNSEIVFTLPENGKTGFIRAIRAQNNRDSAIESNLLPFTVRERGFSLKSGESYLEMIAGETRTLPLYLSGRADMVNLKVETPSDSPLTAILDRTSVIPNDSVNLKIGIHENSNTINGTWKILVRGISGNFEADTEISVHITGAPEITTTELPEGLVETEYYAKLSSGNITGEAVYRLKDGELPPGLDINRQGEIHGKPRHIGRYRVEFEVQDRAGRKSARKYVITVREETWETETKDGSRNRSVHTELPGGNELLFTLETKSALKTILAAEEQLFLVSEEGIDAVRNADGKPIWKQEGKYLKVEYAGGRLHTLGSTGILESREPDLGRLLWRREGIKSFSSSGKILLAETEEEGLVIDTLTGFLRDRIEKFDIDSNDVIWMNGSAYIIQENKIIPVLGNPFSVEFDGRILAAAADAGGMAVVTENALFVLDRELRELIRLSKTPAHGSPHDSPPRIALNGEILILSESGRVAVYNRDNLNLMQAWKGVPGASADIGMGKNGVFIMDQNGFMLRNIFTGNPIWEELKSFRTFALYRGKIFTGDDSGMLYAFGGPSNLNGPELTISLTPKTPDGVNGWYITAPVLTIGSLDRESYVAETKAWIDDLELADPFSPLTIAEGEHQITAYSTDNHGLRSPQEYLSVKVDTVPPRSEITYSEKEPETGWYTAPLSIRLEAWDDMSGIDRIWTNRNSGTDLIVFSSQGIHNFSWYAVDRAGNREVLCSRKIKIDYEPPQVDVSFDDETGEVTITATDHASSVEVIEYRLNNSALTVSTGAAAGDADSLSWNSDSSREICRETLMLKEGIYTLQYRAKDNAGNYSEWRNRTFFAYPSRPQGTLITSVSFNGIPRFAANNLHNGVSLLYVDNNNPDTKTDMQDKITTALANLPSYTIGAEYLVFNPEDLQEREETVIQFHVTQDAVVYLFLPNGIEPPASWNLVEEGLRINRTYYPEGNSMYMKRYLADSMVTIAVPQGKHLPPFVAAQKTGAIFADIHIRQEKQDEGLEGFYRKETNPFNEYEEGSLLVLGYEASPWQWSRRLPLRKRWLINSGEGWLSLDGNRYTIAPESELAVLRFRLELYTPDGQIEYRTEKEVRITRKKEEATE
ncbi:MAG: Ig-like domain repeat protein [Treponema sp.]|nr:Ig-like domain repeat protein [Treponema sp.]